MAELSPFVVYPLMIVSVMLITIIIATEHLLQINRELKHYNPMLKATKRQIKMLHAILARRGMMDMKQQLVSDASDGRTDHSTELRYGEITKLLTHLNQGVEMRLSADKEAGNKMRRRILSMCYSAGWTRFSVKDMKQAVDLARLDNWCIKYSYLNKPLNDYNYNELPKLVSQFENYLKSELK